MKKLLSIAAIAILIGVLSGCSSSSSDMSKNEMDSLRNPSKTMPPEAIEAMKNSGDSMKKQMELNKSQGVDSRGVPISKSGEAGGTPTPSGG